MLAVQLDVERVDGFMDNVVRVRGVVEEVKAVCGKQVVDISSRVAELLDDIDAAGVDAMFDEFVLVREEEKVRDKNSAVGAHGDSNDLLEDACPELEVREMNKEQHE